MFNFDLIRIDYKHDKQREFFKILYNDHVVLITFQHKSIIIRIIK